ncbi:hypothetical protein ASPZODRAFT_132059 [Penicilliopsis zonata CBS 506.65]|uniref:Uncharacterized protein n=1 Tax=Penicilliopsis zonata CBS 506.65 TaxID=1073090 RepID=A0A1L9SIS9_9EURO|nr:hypothetical protein ASPZODRAFT_132059 [Penicilliopsis zonata CBS 506.65]OJJ47115.1 hypothetical protein ASPZODRAFT_132059 [Penicilliopsis zonata CBS 506.65]
MDATSKNHPASDGADLRQGDTEDRRHDDSGTVNGKFRFKSSKSKHRSRTNETDEGQQHRQHHRKRHHRHGSQTTSERKRSKRGHSPSSHERSNARLSPGAAFRESLFDALGDDEGAAYWESVYGQPIHTYDKPSVPKGPNGELEQMSDEEYATYVRARMWERTHEGMFEERERLRQEKARQKAQDQRQERASYEKMQFEQAIEESLKRGRERRRLKAWKTVWEEYQRSWEALNQLTARSGDGQGNQMEGDQKHFRNVIFWPVESGKRRDISRAAVEEFMLHAPRNSSAGEKPQKRKDDSSHILTTLKAERVRWHPDKIQHLYGALGIEEVIVKSVTEVFQILDQMWNEEREKQNRG